MSAITVKFFASLREEVGIAETRVDATSIGGLMATLNHLLGAEKLTLLMRDNVRIAVNQTLIEGDCALSVGDEVAFLPPVTGG